MQEELIGEFYKGALYVTINRQGTLQIWPVKKPLGDGSGQEWNRSAMDIAKLAMRTWTRIKSGKGQYVPVSGVSARETDRAA